MSHVLVCSISFDRDRGGGAVRLAYDLARSLAGAGHSVTVVAEDVHGHGHEVEADDGMTVLRYRLPRSRRFAPLRHRDHLDAASALLRRHVPQPPDVVHGHGLLQYVAALRLYRGRARCCYSIHSPVVDELRITWGAQGAAGIVKRVLGLPVIRRLEAECLHGSDALTAESAYTRELIRAQYGRVAERIRVIPGWTDLGRFRPLSGPEVAAGRRRLGWPTDRPVLFALRRLEPRMGLGNLLRALHTVKQRGYDLYTVIGGSGSELPRLLALRDDLGLTTDVAFPGFLGRDDVPVAYGACDASVVPTAQLECFGLIALEALACGRPTLVTPVGALPEIVRGFESRWIARGNTAGDLAELLMAYLDGGLPRHPVQRLRERVRDRFAFSHALRAYGSIWDVDVAAQPLAGSLADAD